MSTPLDPVSARSTVQENQMSDESIPESVVQETPLQAAQQTFAPNKETLLAYAKASDIEALRPERDVMPTGKGKYFSRFQVRSQNMLDTCFKNPWRAGVSTSVIGAFTVVAAPSAVTAITGSLPFILGAGVVVGLGHWASDRYEATTRETSDIALASVGVPVGALLGTTVGISAGLAGAPLLAAAAAGSLALSAGLKVAKDSYSTWSSFIIIVLLLICFITYRLTR